MIFGDLANRMKDWFVELAKGRKRWWCFVTVCKLPFQPPGKEDGLWNG